MLKYLELELLLKGSASTPYRVEAVYSNAGELRRIERALEISSLEELSRPLIQLRQLRLSPEEVKELGSRLFQDLFAGDLLELFRSLQDEAHSRKSCLRILLNIDSPELAQLPWEYLYDAQHHQFLSLSVETPLIRFLSLPKRPPQPLRLPLRILVMISNPQGTGALDAEVEWQSLQKVFEGSSQVELVALRQPTIGQLLQTLRQSDFHIFHYIGHGAFDERSGEGGLILEGEKGAPYLLTGSRLGAALHDERTLRLAVFNACDGAAATASDPFAGLGQSIVRAGIPAVIAMQTIISDVAAVAFARELYTALADGFPVDAALTEARKLIFTSGGAIEWGSPVLFLRSRDGRILKVESGTGTKKPAQAQPRIEKPPPADHPGTAAKRDLAEAELDVAPLPPPQRDGNKNPRFWLAADSPPELSWDREINGKKTSILWQRRGAAVQKLLAQTAPNDPVLAYQTLGNFVFGLAFVAGSAPLKPGPGKKSSSLGLTLHRAFRFDTGVNLDEIRRALPALRLYQGRLAPLAELSAEQWTTLRALILHRNPSLADVALPQSHVPETNRISIEEILLGRGGSGLRPGETVPVRLILGNAGSAVWRSGLTLGVTFRWWPDFRSSETPAIESGITQALQADVAPGEKAEISGNLLLPAAPGRYRVEWLAKADDAEATRLTVSELSGESFPEVKEAPAEEQPADAEPSMPKAPPEPQPQAPGRQAPERQETGSPAPARLPVGPVVVLSEPPLAEHTLAITVDAGEAEIRFDGRTYRSPLALDPARLLEAASPAEYGRVLFEAIVRDEGIDGPRSATRKGYDRARDRAPESLRVEIELRSLELQDRKWEYLLDPRDGALPLAALQGSPFFRRVGHDARPLAVARPLRILAAIANPLTLGRATDEQGRPVNPRIAALAPLDPVREREILEAALGRLAAAGIAEYRLLEGSGGSPVTHQALIEEVQRGYHVLHLLAHGLRHEGAYHLVLEDEARRHLFVEAEDFARTLHGAGPDLRLVVLASCQSATPDTARALRGLGARLAEAVPAVVAMQGEVRLDTAQIFSQRFYDHLARTGRVDMAMAATRFELYQRSHGAEWQWGFPVLLMSADDGRLFDVDEERARELPGLESRLRDYPDLAPEKLGRALETAARAYGLDPGLASTLRAAFAAPPGAHPEAPAAEPLTRPQDRAQLLGLRPLALTADGLAAAVAGSIGLEVPRQVYGQIASALNAGKHVILIGPPGTGKTSLAHAVCDHAQRQGFAAGAAFTTATADWTTFDTVGGYVPTAQQSLQFRAGKFLEAIRDGRWLVIDEINRAEIDKAFGELFTVLAGQRVDLPYSVGSHALRVLPPARGEGAAGWIPTEAVTGYDYVIHPNWRVVGTMNVYDKSNLFNLSFAFMRRFAFVDLDLPPSETYEGLIDIWLKASRLPPGEGGPAATLRQALLRLLAPDNALMTCRELGPAIVKDMIEYMSDRYQPAADTGELLCEALLLYVTPQLDGIDRLRIGQVRRFLAELVGAGPSLGLKRRIQALYPYLSAADWEE